jgi:cell division protein FtsI/penicillin-binding protein 2
MSMQIRSFRMLILVLMLSLGSTSVFGITKKRTRGAAKPAGGRTVIKTSSKGSKSKLAVSKRRPSRRAVHPTKVMHARRGRRARILFNPWTAPTFADSVSGDYIDGEDPVVRKAAVDALGPYNGTVVVADSANGRILTMVNQNLALKSGFQPCSTIKIVAALAGLSEGIIDRNTSVHLYGRTSMTLTEALARSNNPYFANIGQRLGFEKVSYYARMYGLGEKAGLNIPGEQPGTLPENIPGEGLGMMTSFGSGINLTPLQLTALMGSIANGGTLYYLQYPRNTVEIEHFVPRVKRQLDIGAHIPDIQPGMQGAVEFGTARRAGYASDEPIAGKTGTCTDSKSPTHLGWFGSFNQVGKTRLVVVVLLTGGRGVSGPTASGVAGLVFKNLGQSNYLQQEHSTSPVALISTQMCCAVGDSY